MMIQMCNQPIPCSKFSRPLQNQCKLHLYQIPMLLHGICSRTLHYHQTISLMFRSTNIWTLYIFLDIKTTSNEKSIKEKFIDLFSLQVSYKFYLHLSLYIKVVFFRIKWQKKREISTNFFELLKAAIPNEHHCDLLSICMALPQHINFFWTTTEELKGLGHTRSLTIVWC